MPKIIYFISRHSTIIFNNFNKNMKMISFHFFKVIISMIRILS